MNARIVEYVSRRPVGWSSPQDADMIAIGSVLAFPGIYERIVGTPGHAPLPVWGSGSLVWPRFLLGASRSTHFACLRGPITASLVPDFAGAFGDPGLLVDRVFGAQPKTTKVGVVPHHEQMQNPEFVASLEARELSVIDPRQDDPADVVAQISACETVLAGSLHGLVTADAYGIPNLWLDGPRISQDNLPSDFKFFDYFTSVGRYETGRRRLDKCLDVIRFGDFDLSYMRRLEAIKDGIEASFPL
jgi:hypothetical protein